MLNGKDFLMELAAAVIAGITIFCILFVITYAGIHMISIIVGKPLEPWITDFLWITCGIGTILTVLSCYTPTAPGYLDSY